MVDQLPSIWVLWWAAESREKGATLQLDRDPPCKGALLLCPAAAASVASVEADHIKRVQPLSCDTWNDGQCSVLVAVPLPLLCDAFQGAGVADTIRSGITNLSYFTDRPDIMAYGGCGQPG